MSRSPSQRTPAPRPLVGPTAEEWAALSPEAQEALEQGLVSELCARIEASWETTPPEGEPHQEAWLEAKDALRTFFQKRRPGGLYVAANLPVIYPGRPALSPDLFAVLDVATHPRTSWIVAKEGKGPDLALEFRHAGSWQKDFVDNIKEYAQLGVREYLAFDIGKGQLRLWRLAPGARSYQPVLPQAGRYHSEVLDLEVGVLDGALRFFDGNAELLGGERRVGLLSRLAQDAQARAEQAQAEAQQAQAEAQQAQAEAQQAQEALCEAVLGMLRLRGIATSEAEQAQIRSCRDTEQLLRWLRKVPEVDSAATLLREG